MNWGIGLIVGGIIGTVGYQSYKKGKVLGGGICREAHKVSMSNIAKGAEEFVKTAEADLRDKKDFELDKT